MRKIGLLVLVVCCVFAMFTSCGTVTVDYEDITQFEADLNKGMDLTGNVVTFQVDALAPNSMFGYNMQTGEHLNFCSANNPGVIEGDTVTVKVTEIKSMFGSYIIYYEMIEK